MPETHATSSNLIRCAYCSWTTMRFRGRGKKYGECRLRLHVLDEHEDVYLQRQGLVGQDDARPWTLDVGEIGEQPL